MGTHKWLLTFNVLSWGVPGKIICILPTFITPAAIYSVCQVIHKVKHHGHPFRWYHKVNYLISKRVNNSIRFAIKTDFHHKVIEVVYIPIPLHIFIPTAQSPNALPTELRQQPIKVNSDTSLCTRNPKMIVVSSPIPPPPPKCSVCWVFHEAQLSRGTRRERFEEHMLTAKTSHKKQPTHEQRTATEESP